MEPSKKPHFLRRRDEGETQIKTPQRPEDPTTSGAGPDSTVRDGSDQSGQKDKRSGIPGQSRPATPLRPAASTPVTGPASRGIAATASEIAAPAAGPSVGESATRSNRQFRVDHSHEARETRTQTFDQTSDTDSTGAGNHQVPRRPVRAPRSRAAFVAQNQQPPSAPQSSAPTAETRRSRTPARNRSADSEVSVPPAPSVADSSDLLDRILSSVQREKR